MFAKVKALLESGSTGPYHDVMELLDNMKSQLIAEQAAQREIYNSQMADCQAEQTLRQGEMDEATAAKAAATASLNACT